MKLYLESHCASSKKYLCSVLTTSALICVSVQGWEVTHRQSSKESGDRNSGGKGQNNRSWKSVQDWWNALGQAGHSSAVPGFVHGAAGEGSVAVAQSSPTQPLCSGNKASSGAGLLHVGIVFIKKEAFTRCRGIICLLKSCGPKHLIIMGFDAAVGFLDCNI